MARANISRTKRHSNWTDCNYFTDIFDISVFKLYFHYICIIRNLLINSTRTLTSGVVVLRKNNLRVSKFCILVANEVLVSTLRNCIRYDAYKSMYIGQKQGVGAVCTSVVHLDGSGAARPAARRGGRRRGRSARHAARVRRVGRGLLQEAHQPRRQLRARPWGSVHITKCLKLRPTAHLIYQSQSPKIFISNRP